MKENIDVTIGLEIHVQLKTKSKLFCSCPTNYRDKEENTNICPICTGQPGAKPLGLNSFALDQLLKIGIALNCKFVDSAVIQRKHYFYPDLPNGFQRTSKPIGLDGKLGKIRIKEIHIEEDPGRYELREGSVDYNRAGVPLIEIVTEPDMKSPADAREFLDELDAILNYLDAGRDEPGSLRVDANISINNGTRVEIKNINSFKGVYDALNYEIIRQQNILRHGGKIVRETRHFDEGTGATVSLRKKETEDDYRYMPDPDVPPILIKEDRLLQLKKQMPELPRAKAERFERNYKIKSDDAWILSMDMHLARLFEEMVFKVESKGFIIDAQKIASWIRGPLKKQLNYRNLSFSDSGLNSEWLSDLFIMFMKGDLTDRGAEQVLIKMIEKKENPSKIASELNLLKLNDTSQLEAIVEKIISSNEKAVKDYLGGNEKTLNFLIGQVIKESKGRADSKLVKEIILRKIKNN
ncbi:MAG: Asp-tRNA(Asn)/Glu-tRNA(Gln) amidotransferase subunit GatB [Candidatus Micrarchaeota archaeon]|nr:Asp-tRNA(Asn)/Glu-tRNA(Gln) amidotransferase subunit GatB [Candidatus Micrarchaeota archaeon]